MKTMALVDTSDFTTYPTGGQLTSIRAFLRYMSLRREADLRIILIGIRQKGSSVGDTVSIDGVDYPFYGIYEDDNDPNNPGRSLRKAFFHALIKKRKLLRSLKVDLFYLHTPEAFWPLKLTMRHKRIAVFSHGSFFNIYDKIRFKKYNNPLIKWGVLTYIRQTIRHSDLIYVLDDTTYRQYTPMNDNVRRVFNSIDTDLFRRGAPVDGERIRALFVGRLSANKNVDRIIEAVVGLDSIHTLTVIGDGEENSRLRQLVDEIDTDGQVTMAGKKLPDELPEYYKQANILVMCSDVEGLPMVILEAYGAGLGVVSTKVGAIGDILKDGINGHISDGTSEGTRQAVLQTFDSIETISQTNTVYSSEFDYRRVNENVYENLSELLRD